MGTDSQVCALLHKHSDRQCLGYMMTMHGQAVIVTQWSDERQSAAVAALSKVRAVCGRLSQCVAQLTIAKHNKI